MPATAAQPGATPRSAIRFLRLRSTQTSNLAIPTRTAAPPHARLRCHLSRSSDSTPPSPPTTPDPDPDPDPDPESESESEDTLRFAFACGGAGAGGRVYSAIALADELHASLPSSRSLIIGAPAPSLESSAAAAASYPFAPVPLHCLPRGILAAALHLRRFRPHVLVATGGAPALQACLAALMLRLPFVIQDQDASPAPATRLLAPFARRIFLAFNAPVRLLPKRRCAVYGNPIRMSILKCRASKTEALARFFPRAGLLGEHEAQVVLVLGGAEGSPEINVAVLNVYYELLRRNKDRYIIWQTGTETFCEMESLVKGHRRLFLTPFLHELEMAYAACDVVISRAGAMTCTEILATGKPSILVSYIIH
ncbi:UDP-Glycosyltransferase superfamily protein [Zea mays]|uniref:UDP-Glycosyltransferase superfamily protein n=1 Tax=Zea mays TaxID=4577 RepID=A0A1D6MTG5_MAIZE|nr:UDP-Glycosyltransferase superfamily protein [Zea mays]